MKLRSRKDVDLPGQLCRTHRTPRVLMASWNPPRWTCPECDKEKFAARYKADSSKKLASNAKWLLKNREKVRAYHWAYALKRFYGLSPAEYDAILARQNGVCAICFADGAGYGNGKLHVDHDHGTGKIRGLLCGHCNRGIGLFFDRPDVVARAAKYLEVERGQTAE